MNTELQKVIDKVKNLLALSKSDNVHEATAAANKANQLIDEYRLSSMDLSEDNSEIDPLIEDADAIYESGRQIFWKVNLVIVLANHYGCAVYNHANYSTGRMFSRFKLIGRTSDIQIVKYMFSWLSMECQRLAEINGKGRGKVYIQSYCLGFVSGIKEQLNKSRKEAEKTVNSTALVKLNNRLDEADAFMNATHNLKSTTTKSQSQQDVWAFHSGQLKGESTHLGPVLGNGKVKLLGS